MNKSNLWLIGEIISHIYMLQVFFNNTVVKQVDISTLNGSIGILPKHVPVLGMLKPGIVRIVDKDGKSFRI